MWWPRSQSPAYILNSSKALKLSWFTYEWASFSLALSWPLRAIFCVPHSNSLDNGHQSLSVGSALSARAASIWKCSVLDAASWWVVLVPWAFSPSRAFLKLVSRLLTRTPKYTASGKHQIQCMAHIALHWPWHCTLTRYISATSLPGNASDNHASLLYLGTGI